MSKKDAVIACLPDVDILCIQEVWERCWASAMIDQLGLKYNHFIHGIILHFISFKLFMHVGS